MLINQESLLEHLKQLSSDEFQGRKVATAGNLKAQQYISTQLKNLSVLPFKNKFVHHFEFHSFLKTTKGNNVIAFIEGSHKKDEFIILTAHFDHLGKKGGKIYNGADDNASGTSALLSIAEQLQAQPLNHSVIILFTDAEEANLKGSKAFVRQNSNVLDKIKLNINMDMLAGGKSSNKLHYLQKGLTTLLTEDDFIAFKNSHNFIETNVVKGFRNRLRGQHHKTNWVKASDHSTFYDNGIPFIYYGVGTHKNYHTPEDNYENTNLTLFINSTNIIYQQLVTIDSVI